MAYLKATGLKVAPYATILAEVEAARRLFRPRGGSQAEGWFSLDIIRDCRFTPESKSCPTFVRWIQTCVPWMPNRAYIARFDPGGSVDWHADLPDRDAFSQGFILGLYSPKGSFVEFEDGTKYVYRPGVGYHARLGVRHRAVNPTGRPRITAFVGSPRT